MKTITDDELQVLLENINRNMKEYDDDISVKMEHSDKAELRHMKIKKTETPVHQKEYAEFSSVSE